MKNNSAYPPIVILALALSTSLFAADKGGSTAAAATSRASSGSSGAGAVGRASSSGGATATRSAGSEPHFSHASSNPVASSINNRAAQDRGGNAAVAARFANGKVPRPGADFNRGNHYGGRWSGAKDHPGWNHDGIHVWNHHHYRWYDGGWLILDDDYGGGEDGTIDTGGPVSFNSIVRCVQAELAREGYYTGAMDGGISPEFRKAIEKYQGAHGLHVTGLVDAPVIESLQVD